MKKIKRQLFKSLWPSDIIWWHWSGSSLAQVMPCCLTAPSHYLNPPCLRMADRAFLTGYPRDMSFSSLRVNLSNLEHFNVEEWSMENATMFLCHDRKMQQHLYISSNKSACTFSRRNFLSSLSRGPSDNPPLSQISWNQYLLLPSCLKLFKT